MNIVAVTACPSGVAHTYLAAESLEVAAKKRGHEISVETQGSIGIENRLDDNAIKVADVVILSNDVGIIEENRFKGKPIIRLSCGECVNKVDKLIIAIEKKLGKTPVNN